VQGADKEIASLSCLFFPKQVSGKVARCCAFWNNKAFLGESKAKSKEVGKFVLS
jgi:hypothetical protein